MTPNEQGLLGFLLLAYPSHSIPKQIWQKQSVMYINSMSVWS